MGFSPSHIYGRGMVSEARAVRAFWAVSWNDCFKNINIFREIVLSGQQDELLSNSFNKFALSERHIEKSF